MSTLLIAPLVAAAVIAVAVAALALQRWWQRRLLGTVLIGGAARADTEPVPDILYFTGESCTVCHIAQRPALRRLVGLIDDVAVREIDVARDPASARTYRVMTLPTTVVLDAAGRTAAVNVGFTPETVLRQQVQAARESSRAGAVA